MILLKMYAKINFSHKCSYRIFHIIIARSYSRGFEFGGPVYHNLGLQPSGPKTLKNFISIEFIIETA